MKTNFVRLLYNSKTKFKVANYYCCAQITIFMSHFLCFDKLDWFWTPTSSAGSATLWDTSWARLIIQLGPIIRNKGTNLHWGGTPHNKTLSWEGGTPHLLSCWWNNWRGENYILGGGDTTQYFLDGFTIGVGAPHNIKRYKHNTVVCGSVRTNIFVGYD